jgi:high-affinity iron transporter
VGGALPTAADTLPEEGKAILEGVMALLAVAFVTWMVFWMARNARQLKGQLEGHLDKAIAAGAGALAGMAFISVSREGFETALFLWTAFETSGGGWASIFGAVLGMAVAILLGLLLYRGALRINLRTFFMWTGAALIVVAAGVFSYGIHELQEVGVFPFLEGTAFDITGAFPDNSWQYAVFRGIFSVRTAPSWLEVFAWLAYVVPTMALFFRALNRPIKPAKPSVPASQSAAA